MDLGQIQAYAYFFLTAFMVFILYGYIWHLYKTQRTGERDWEKYGKIALDDDIGSKPIEKIREREKKEE